ncbi:MAG: hypothetical protein U5N86_10160 [Planctomycetota bacterium]|nr:hypothetical protein [Planctomycetota bacterium]
MTRNSIIRIVCLALFLGFAGWMFAEAEKAQEGIPDVRTVEYKAVTFVEFVRLAQNQKLDDTSYGMVIGYTRALDGFGNEGWILDSTYHEKNVLMLLFRRHIRKGYDAANYDVQYMLQTPPFMEERTNKALRELVAEGELYVSEGELKKLREQARVLALQKLGENGWYRYRGDFIEPVESSYSISHVFMRLVEEK